MGTRFLAMRVPESKTTEGIACAGAAARGPRRIFGLVTSQEVVRF